MLSSIDPGASSSYEIRYGWRLLSDLCSEQCRPYNSLFFEKVDNSIEGLEEYYTIIKEPMWLLKMESKFIDGLYDTILEFVCDVRIMFLNCYHFNGRQSRAAKIANKLEMIFEQKLMLLPRDIRELCTMKMCLGEIQTADPSASENVMLRRRYAAVSNSGDMAGAPVMAYYAENECQFATEEEIGTWFSETIQRFKKPSIDREEKVILSKWDSWKKTLYTESVSEIFKHSSEWAAVMQFFHLIVPTLGISEEDLKCMNPLGLELGLLLPQRSSIFGQIMFGILTNSSQRGATRKSSFVEYDVWEERLKTRVGYWYRHLNERCHGNFSHVCSILGIEEASFRGMGQLNPMAMRKFHELSAFQRVHICKALADSSMFCQESLARRLETAGTNWNHSRVTVIGADKKWNYFRFPILGTGFNLWIYKEKRPVDDVVDEDDSKQEKSDTKKQKAGRGRPKKELIDRGRERETVDKSVEVSFVKEESNMSCSDTKSNDDGQDKCLTDYNAGLSQVSQEENDKEEEDEKDDEILNAMYTPIITRPDRNNFELCVKNFAQLHELKTAISSELDKVDSKLQQMPRKKGRAPQQRLDLEEEKESLNEFVDNLTVIAETWSSLDVGDTHDIEQIVKVKIGREVGLCPKPVTIQRRSRLIPPPKPVVPMKRSRLDIKDRRGSSDCVAKVSSRPLPTLVTNTRMSDGNPSSSHGSSRRRYLEDEEQDETPKPKRPRKHVHLMSFQESSGTTSPVSAAEYVNPQKNESNTGSDKRTISVLANHVRERSGLSSYQQLMKIRTSSSGVTQNMQPTSTTVESMNPSSNSPCVSRISLSNNSGLQIPAQGDYSNSLARPKSLIIARSETSNGISHVNNDSPVSPPIINGSRPHLKITNNSNCVVRRVYPSWTPPEASAVAVNGNGDVSGSTQVSTSSNNSIVGKVTSAPPPVSSSNQTVPISQRTLYRIGGYLFSSNAEPIHLEGGVVSHIDASTIPEDVLRNAKKRILQDMRR